jgi:diphthamide synthase subunit DPH2
MNLEKYIKEEIIKLKEKINKEDIPIAIQIPEGLKQYSEFILDLLNDYEPVLFVDLAMEFVILKTLKQ